MSQNMPDLIRSARATLAEVGERLSGLTAAHTRAVAALDRIEDATVKAGVQHDIQHDVQHGVEDLPPASDHRRNHRPGRPAKIDSDPELQSFIRVRIDRMTFNQIAKAITDQFPPERRIGKSAIHEWWQRNMKTNP